MRWIRAPAPFRPTTHLLRRRGFLNCSTSFARLRTCEALAAWAEKRSAKHDSFARIACWRVLAGVWHGLDEAAQAKPAAHGSFARHAWAR